MKEKIRQMMRNNSFNIRLDSLSLQVHASVDIDNNSSLRKDISVALRDDASLEVMPFHDNELSFVCFSAFTNESEDGVAFAELGAYLSVIDIEILGESLIEISKALKEELIEMMVRQ